MPGRRWRRASSVSASSTTTLYKNQGFVRACNRARHHFIDEFGVYSAPSHPPQEGGLVTPVMKETEIAVQPQRCYQSSECLMLLALVIGPKGIPLFRPSVYDDHAEEVDET